MKSRRAKMGPKPFLLCQATSSWGSVALSVKWTWLPRAANEVDELRDGRLLGRLRRISRLTGDGRKSRQSKVRWKMLLHGLDQSTRSCTHRTRVHPTRDVQCHAPFPTWAMNPRPCDNPDCISVLIWFPCIWGNLRALSLEANECVTFRDPNAGLCTNASTWQVFIMRKREQRGHCDESFIEFNLFHLKNCLLFWDYVIGI